MTGDRPTAVELLSAVCQWLTDDHAPTLEGGARFQALVAAQALSIAARELEAGPAHAAADAAALAPLVKAGSADDVDALRRLLAAEIRAGDHDADLPAVARVLREHVRRKLALARPGYDRPD